MTASRPQLCVCGMILPLSSGNGVFPDAGQCSRFFFLLVRRTHEGAAVDLYELQSRFLVFESAPRSEVGPPPLAVWALHLHHADLAACLEHVGHGTAARNDAALLGEVHRPEQLGPDDDAARRMVELEEQ